MPTEKFANAPTTTLNGAIDSSVTSITVTSAVSFPSTGNFRILIDSEIMLVTTVSGTTFTVVRASEGTTAASHNNASSVDGIITKGAVDSLRSDLITSDTFANRPTAEINGRIYIPNNGFYYSRDTGSAWESYGPIFPITEINNGSFAWINQGTSTIVTTNGGVALTSEITSTHSLRCRVKSVSFPGTFTLGFIPNIIATSSSHMGLLIRDTVTTRIITLSYQYNFGWVFGGFAWNDEVSFSTSYFTVDMPSMPFVWFRLVDNGTTRSYQYSFDAQNFFTIFSHATNTFLTPNQAGFYVSGSNATYPAAMTALSWKE